MKRWENAGGAACPYLHIGEKTQKPSAATKGNNKKKSSSPPLLSLTFYFAFVLVEVF